MDTHEAFEVVGYITNLWPEWKLTDELKSLWCSTFRGYDGGTIKAAADEYKLTKQGSYKNPKIDELINTAKQKQQVIDADHGEPESPFGIKCISHDKNPHLVGREYKQFITIKRKGGIIAAAKSSMPSFMALEKAAQVVAGKVKALYGGKWAIVWHEGYGESVPF